MISKWSLKKSYVVETFVASSLVSFFNLFSKRVLKILATVLASSKAGQKIDNVLKVGFFLNTCSNIFSTGFALVRFQNY